ERATAQHGHHAFVGHWLEMVAGDGAADDHGRFRLFQDQPSKCRDGAESQDLTGPRPLQGRDRHDTEAPCNGATIHGCRGTPNPTDRPGTGVLVSMTNVNRPEEPDETGTEFPQKLPPCSPGLAALAPAASFTR